MPQNSDTSAMVAKPVVAPGDAPTRGTPATGRPPVGKTGAAGAGGTSDLKWKTLFSFGFKFLGACRGLILIYFIFCLTDDAIDRGVAQLFGYLTNQINISTSGASATPARGGNSATSVEQTSPGSTPEKPATPEKASPRRLIGSYVGWAVLAIGVVAFAIPRKWLVTRMDALLSNRLRTKLFDRVLRQSPEFFHKYDPGQLNAIINTMTLETEMTLRQIIVDPVEQFIVLVGTTALVSYNFVQIHKEPIPIFGLHLPSAVIPPIIVILALFSPYMITKIAARIRAAATAVQTYMLALSSLVTGATQSPEEIQAMEAENIFSDKHNASLDKSLAARLQQSVTIESVNLLNSLPSLLVQIVLLGFAVWLVLKGNGTARPGDVVAVVLLAPMLMSPIQALSGYIIMASSSWPNIATVINILESQGEIQPGQGATDQQRVTEPTIEARDLTFSYTPPAPLIFNGISFTVPPRKITGFVAKMGQGKTTFFKLALRFYDPQRGQILIDGRPTTEYSLETLRQRIAMMSQFPAFFFDSVRENLRMAKPSATDQEIQAICERTGVWKILCQKLPSAGLNSVLDANLAAGKTLSGGQRKLLALTRCLLRDPAILFLDEPTVGMDNEEKFEIREMLREGTRGRTVMVVDHDVNWLLQFCDYFIVLDEGRIVERGTAEELLSRDGLLYQLYMAAMGPKTKEIATYIARA